MSLADELLADFEEAGDDVGDHDGEGHMLELAEVDDVTMETQSIGKNSVRNIAKLRDSEELEDVMKKVNQYSKQKRKEQVAGPVEYDPEYQLIVKANNLTVEIDNEINVIHKFTRDNYLKRFPELESLISDPLQYVCTVKELGNNILENSKNNAALQEILTSATIMVVSVTASTTQGSLLTDEEMKIVEEACDMALELSEFKRNIHEYVESRMTFIAPNLSIIVGASTAAKIMGIAGGLTNLSKMPACNIMLLGSQRKILAGFSSTAMQSHYGHLYECDLVQKSPPDLRKKAARLVSAKCALASRVDSFHESQDGATGDSMRADIEGKLDKLQEPPPVKRGKALPVPIDQARKKRGGRRARKMKERLGLSEMRKAANRMNFGEIEEDAYQEDLGFSLGTIGKSKTGRIRGPVVDSKTKARISKTLQQKIAKEKQTWGGSTTVKKQVSGTASSVAFTPLQGLEIVNPQAAEKKVQEANAKYFSSTASFVKELGNNILENSKNNAALQEILTSATIMVVSVTASTTQGSLLTEEEMKIVEEACDMALELSEFKRNIHEYVESRMTFIAPNLSIIVGASTAAKIMGIAGGLTNLSKMPACNIMLLGSQRKILAGFSSTAMQSHYGHLYECDLVQKSPPDLRKKAARLVSAKCALASRVDSFHESQDGATGDSMRADIEGKLDKLQEPPPVKRGKALPVPIDQARKKRGGRRARKMKERLGLSEMRKAANRMNFGEIEEDAYQEDLGFSLGTIGKSKTGRIRGPVVDSKTKARISKTLQQKIAKEKQTWGGSTTVKKQVSGTASSVAFTPLQGLEIVNPQAAEKKVQEANAKYFSSTASFVKVEKQLWHK